MKQTAYLTQPFVEIRNNMRVGFFLGLRDIKRSSKWTTLLIICIMTITFLNLVVVRGILVGLIEGSIIANRSYFTSDIIIGTPANKTQIEDSVAIINTLKNIEGIGNYSYRYTASARLEAGYDKIRAKDEKPETVAGTVTGIDVIRENAVTNLSSKLIDGEFLSPGDFDQIVIGVNLLEKYQSQRGEGAQALRSASVGSKVKLTVNNQTREVTIKGVVKTKVGQVDTRILINENQLRQMLGRNDFNVNEIAVKLKPQYSAEKIKNILVANDVIKTATVQTAIEGLPQFVKDIQQTFNILGNVIGSIGLAVATISIFIVIFVNAITRRKFIGILKGIGVSPTAIEFSYMIQSLFYAVCGISIAVIIIFTLILPYFQNNPIDFPFSDGIVVAAPIDVATRAILLLVATVIAGYVPARIVVKQHTLDAILGR